MIIESKFIIVSQRL